MVNFLVGTLVVLVMFAFAGGIKGDEGAEPPAWYYWVFGGLAGVAIVTTTLITVRELGAGGVTAATIAGQLTLLGGAGPPRRAGPRRAGDHVGQAAGDRAPGAGTVLIVARL